jgi:hypothetical protein
MEQRCYIKSPTQLVPGFSPPREQKANLALVLEAQSVSGRDFAMQQESLTAREGATTSPS